MVASDHARITDHNPSSLLMVPAWQFEEPKDADTYLAGLDSRPPVFGDGPVYAPNSYTEQLAFRTTTELAALPPQKFTTRCTTRHFKQPTPIGGRNMTLIYSGRREFYLSSDLTDPLLQRLNSGHRDCYVTVAKTKGFKIGKLRAVADDIYVGRAAHVVVFARWPVFGDGGKLSHMQYRLNRIQFNTADSNPLQNDILKFVQEGDTGQLGRGETVPQTPVEAIWNKLTQQAIEGFDKHCNDMVSGSTGQ